jgi:pentapeptide MXKDX repeat protein
MSKAGCRYALARKKGESNMRKVWKVIVVAVVILGVDLTVAGCNSPTATPKDKMSSEKMTGDKMSGDKMATDKMATDKMEKK